MQADDLDGQEREKEEEEMKKGVERKEEGKRKSTPRVNDGKDEDGESK